MQRATEALEELDGMGDDHRGVIHFDFILLNCRLHRGRHWRAGVIDFDDVGSGYCLYDIAPMVDNLLDFPRGAAGPHLLRWLRGGTTASAAVAGAACSLDGRPPDRVRPLGRGDGTSDRERRTGSGAHRHPHAKAPQLHRATGEGMGCRGHVVVSRTPRQAKHAQGQEHAGVPTERTTRQRALPKLPIDRRHRPRPRTSSRWLYAT